MRICYISHASAHFTAPYVDWFAARGDEVHVVSLSHGDVPNAVNHHPWKGKFDPFRASWHYFWAIPGVRRTVRRIAPDIVHAHYLTSNGLLAAAAGVHPLVVSARGSDVNLSMHHPLKRALLRFVLRRADLINPVSASLADQLLSLGASPEKMLCLTGGIETSRFLERPTPRRPGPVRVICTRHLRPLYGCDLILRAAGRLAERGVPFELMFAGAGDLQARLEREAGRLRLSDRVVFRGGYESAELPRLLADADVYVSASKSDGTSLSLLEAMAAGVFPVVSDIAANRDWISSENGMLFGVNRPDELATCLEAAIRDDALRGKAVSKNRELVSAEGDRDRNMARLAEHYDLLVHRRVVRTLSPGGPVRKDDVS